MTTKTPKELAELVAVTALDSLKAALQEEAALRSELRDSRREYKHDWLTPVTRVAHDLASAARRSDAAFAAWRKAQEAVPL